MDAIYICYILIALLLGSVLLLWKKLKETKEEASDNWRQFWNERRKHEMLKNKYNKLSIESKLANKKMDMMNYSNTKIRISHLRDILSLKIEQGFSDNFIKKNKLAQKLLDRNLRNFSCATDTSLSIFDGDVQYVNIFLMDYESKIIAPILNELKNPFRRVKKRLSKIDPPNWDFEI